jgi:adenylyl-sulfate kinase
METQPQGPGFIVWLTGMNRAGKSTLATNVVSRLTAAGLRAELLDEGGAARMLLEGLGTAKEDHAKVVARLGLVAKAVMRAGGVAVCAALSPYRDAREALRKEARRLVEVFVDCSMDELQRRDSSGLYRKALAGEVQNVPGVDVPYEPPARPEVTVHTDQLPVAEAALRIFQAMVDNRYIAPADFGRVTGGQRPKRAKPSGRGAARRGGPARAAARKPPRKPNLRGAKASKRRR